MGADRFDVDLREAVLAELAWDTRVNETQIDVGVEGGKVTLVGTVSSYAMKLAAQQAAAQVEDVHDLVNEIDVKPRIETAPNDEELADIIERVLAWDALVPEHHLAVAVANGWVTLNGHVEVAAQRAEAERAVGRLEGVRGVDNRIMVAEPDVAPDDVRRAIAEALFRRAAHRLDHIDVIVAGPSVTLRGSVQSDLEKTAILGAVSHAPGIGHVHDELRVDPAS